MSNMPTQSGPRRWTQPDVQHFPDTPLPLNASLQSNCNSPLVAVATHLQNFIAGCEKGRTAPRDFLAKDALQTLQRLWPCDATSLECSFPQRKKLLASDTPSADCQATFRFVDGDKKCFALLYDDYRNPTQLVVVTKDSLTGQETATAMHGFTGERFTFQTEQHTDAMYREIGDLHNSGERFFF